jgi:hypothetical protein
VLDLCSNQITRPGAVAVTKALLQARAAAGAAAAPLELLALDENGISEGGITQIQQLLKVREARLRSSLAAGDCHHTPARAGCRLQQPTPPTNPLAAGCGGGPQGAFGSDAMLGPLDDNDPDMGDDEGADAMDEDDELTAALAATHL